jgi:hypothetical protein
MGYDDCVRFLISSGADVNVKGETPTRGSGVALTGLALDPAGIDSVLNSLEESISRRCKYQMFLSGAL